jgi:hypothetical protein
MSALRGQMGYNTSVTSKKCKYSSQCYIRLPVRLCHILKNIVMCMSYVSPSNQYSIVPSIRILKLYSRRDYKPYIISIIVTPMLTRVGRPYVEHASLLPRGTLCSCINPCNKSIGLEAPANKI